MYLRDEAKRYGQAYGHWIYCEANLKRVKAIQMIDTLGDGVGKADTKATASPEFLQAMEQARDAKTEVETMRALRDAAIYKIEVWRSQNSARKQGI